MRVGFVGTGAIASAMVTGLSSAGVEGSSIRLSPRNSVVAADLANRLAQVYVGCYHPAEFTLQAKVNSTDVKWATGRSFSMDSLIGKGIDTGLASLKALTEK